MRLAGLLLLSAFAVVAQVPNAAVIASVVYDAATRGKMLPRKQLPKPQETAPTATK